MIDKQRDGGRQRARAKRGRQNMESTVGGATDGGIRAAGIEDLPAILEIYNEVVEHSTAIYALEPESLGQRQ